METTEIDLETPDDLLYRPEEENFRVAESDGPTAYGDAQSRGGCSLSEFLVQVSGMRHRLVSLGHWWLSNIQAACSCSYFSNCFLSSFILMV